ncbi:MULTISPECIES: FeoA family protein [Clostridium]|uniref:FeoA family protein n=1 Tax=Clostridium aquiflavi TaxID=3073603 RepID=A0ABU1EI76_9CLOT|nr:MULTISPECIES: FeoA family protein [unclassified Clostridium]MDR5587792.1 FeoA family protein [Clostridium sp. 5N-1]NFG62727.1 ferrous iron transport protein A [Clostridium botulinum]NFQ10843.1 ferrous iron transport protein A [Clostridium botulinum]
MNDNSLSNTISLNKLPLGNKCKVSKLDADGVIRRRFLDLGLITGTEVESLGQSPSGDPIAYLIRGAVIAIRSEDASKILVETL